MMQSQKKENEIIENYTNELDVLRDRIISGEDGVSIVSIFEEAMVKSDLDSTTIIKAIQEGKV